MPDLNLADIQGFILRGYKMPALRQFLLRIRDVAAAKRFLGDLVSGAAAGSQITSAVDWQESKPAFTVNLGFTFPGLRALGLSDASLQSFPEDFREGAVARADRVGDTGANAPANWIAPLVSPDFHVLLTLFAKDADTRASASTVLRALSQQHGATEELYFLDGDALPGFLAHFGYADGFSQPTIEGAPFAGLTDPLPVAPPGEFLLGHPSQFRDWTYPVPAPEELGANGSFLAFRILEQDAHGFETFLDTTAGQLGMDKERLAAKICGRWRNGVPLALSPEKSQPEPPLPPDRMNHFDYLPTEQYPGGYDDTRGFRCPIGSHIRRLNPRGSRVAGGGGTQRRIVRRGLPYGPPYDPAHPNDGHERGLLGMFIGVSLQDQFEFLMSEWVNDGLFAPNLGRSRDPVLGNSTSADSKFVIPVENRPPHVIKGFSRFVTTRGGAYCFLPSLRAIQYLAALPPG